MTLSGLRDRPPFRAAGRGARSLWLILGLAACDTTTAAGPGAPLVLTTRGDYMQDNSPPGVEVTLGAKRVRQVNEPAAPDQSLGAARLATAGTPRSP